MKIKLIDTRYAQSNNHETFLHRRLYLIKLQFLSCGWAFSYLSHKLVQWILVIGIYLNFKTLFLWIWIIHLNGVRRKGRVPEKYSVSLTRNNLMLCIQEKATKLSKITSQFWMLFLATQMKGSFSQNWPDLIDILHGNFTYPSIWFGFQKSFLIKFWFYGYPKKHFQTHCNDKIKTRWNMFYGCWDALETLDVDKRKTCETIWCSTWLTCAFCSFWR